MVAIVSCVSPGSVGSTIYLVLSLLEKSLLGPFEVETDTECYETSWLGPMTSLVVPVTCKRRLGFRMQLSKRVRVVFD